MSNKEKMLVYVNSNDMIKIYVNYFSNEGFEVYCRRFDSDNIYGYVEEIRPDVLIIPVIYRYDDLLKFVYRVRANFTNIKIIALSYIESARAYRRITNAGADRFVTMPVSIHELLVTIRTTSPKKRKPMLSPMVSEFFIKNRIIHSDDNFTAAFTSIEAVIKNPELLHGSSEDLYNHIVSLSDCDPKLLSRSLKQEFRILLDNSRFFRAVEEAMPFGFTSNLSNTESISVFADVFSKEYSLFPRNYNLYIRI